MKYNENINENISDNILKSICIRGKIQDILLNKDTKIYPLYYHLCKEKEGVKGMCTPPVHIVRPSRDIQQTGKSNCLYIGDTETRGQGWKELLVIINPFAINYFTINKYEKSLTNVLLESSPSLLTKH